ncbi:hypothetical protein LRS03_05250 [Rhizobacter sp. J219]|uniref:hypothetical protein n=1 Tax=Rhizobacter sp. J219 TaxID=2898430 RepID=UPI00215080FF|nr:hypothetical protein [Rhizobacter sp. J219]MCR5882296.1 hypothetical protein [Rhizobacter sp. J219]
MRHPSARRPFTRSEAPVSKQKMLLFLLFAFALIPFLIDWGVHLVLENRAREFSRVQAQIVVAAPPVLTPRYLRGGMTTALSVMVTYDWNGRSRSLEYSVPEREAAEFVEKYRSGQGVSIWVSDTEVQVHPPARTALFEWFPYLYLVCGFVIVLGYLLAGALRWDYERLYKRRRI